MASIEVRVVSAERELFTGQASMVLAPAAMGEVGIKPRHAPMMTLLTPGEVRVTGEDGNEEAFYVAGGLMEVQPHLVTVMSDTVVRAHDLDESAALEAKQRAEQHMQDRGADFDYARAQAELAEAVAQLQTIQRMRRRAGR